MTLDMATRDPHRFSNELDDAAINRLIQRLESRAKDAVFSRLLDRYAAHLKLPDSAKVLDIGCGTGAVLRTLAQRAGFEGQLYGVDQCQPFVDAAREFTNDQGMDGRIDSEYQRGHLERLGGSGPDGFGWYWYGYQPGGDRGYNAVW